jgi:hypothetical protein
MVMFAQQKLENCDRSCIFLKAAMIFNMPVARYLRLKITLQQAAGNLPRKEF